MSIEAKSIGRILHLAGPSSSGKSTYAKELTQQGWEHVEADAILSKMDIEFFESVYRDDLQTVKDHIHAHPTPFDVVKAIHGDLQPIREPSAAFHQACARLLEAMDRRWKCGHREIHEELCIRVLDEASRLAKLGKNVIIDDIRLLERQRGAGALVLKSGKPKNIWTYKGIDIEQVLKYVPIHRLMHNVIRRNPEPPEHRDPLLVLYQYADQFPSTREADAPIVGNLAVRDLAKWIERSIKMNFFDIDSAHTLAHLEGDDLDADIQRRLSAFMEELKSLKYSQNPKDREVHQRKFSEWCMLNDRIERVASDLFEMMGIDAEDRTIDLTYRTRLDIAPTII